MGKERKKLIYLSESNISYLGVIIFVIVWLLPVAGGLVGQNLSQDKHQLVGY